MTRIAIDAMGGDNAPRAIVEGAVWASMEYNIPIELVGKLYDIERELDRIDQEGILVSIGGGIFPSKSIKVNTKSLDIKKTHASEIIEMGEAPGQAIRKKKNSSIVLSVNSVVTGSSDAVVAAGSTGAAMGASLFGLGRLPGIERPAIATVIPTMKGPLVLIDSGANTDCTPTMLYQFGLMGSIYAKSVLGIENPRIALLNIGEEAGKGDELAKDTYKLFDENKDKLNFIGNAEGKEIFLGNCDVIVCDGFVGNVTLKTIEGVARMFFYMIKKEFCHDNISKVIGLLVRPILKKMYSKINYEEFGGALLLGVKGITVICHGRSSAYAIKNAVKVAYNAVESGVNKTIASYYGEI
ncbi:MAG: phosphate acyltransferase PlsX [Candidatus Gastranaerophilales bacterium]|nr:phosphate acyltransferase PlsX [Candidatus Gastranaerophilales bacterium]